MPTPPTRPDAPQPSAAHLVHLTTLSAIADDLQRMVDDPTSTFGLAGQQVSLNVQNLRGAIEGLRATLGKRKAGRPRSTRKGKE